jgi:hypothetical protein
VTGRYTPEAFRRVYEKEIEGFGELCRMLSYEMCARRVLTRGGGRQEWLSSSGGDASQSAKGGTA